MDTICVFFADGFETIEALATVDILRRAELNVVTVSIMGQATVNSAQNVKIECDALFEQCDFDSLKAIVLPGGMPGASNLANYKPLQNLIIDRFTTIPVIAAICAAPMVLGRLSLLKGRRVTCYPGFETELTDAVYTDTFLEEDGNLITACGPAASNDFGFAIVKHLGGQSVVDTLKSQMLINKNK